MNMNFYFADGIDADQAAVIEDLQKHITELEQDLLVV